MFHDILIIGGGASGLAAAVVCKDMGKDAAIIEGTERIGRKLLTTGNGRCNISNRNILISRYHGADSDFPKYALENFNYNETNNFFSLLGLPLVTLEDDKVFPLSLQASSVLDVFRMALEERDIPLYNNSKVKSIIKIKNGFKVLTAENTFQCRKLILCCGGKSYASTGSDGSGYKIAKELGHNIITPFPALVQLKLKHGSLKALSGIKFNGTAKIDSKMEYGEILFTDYGISGPPIIQLSRIAAKSLSMGEDPYIEVDMMPQMSTLELKDFIENHFGIFYYRSVFNSMIGIINKKLIPILLKEAGITDIHKECGALTKNEKISLIGLMKCWKFKIYDTNSFSNAQVTAGGIDTKEVSNETLQSKLFPNLYFAGEILDVDGDCGGFNLQWAWASAYIAAKNASAGD
ncbi:MAG: NAD(P)/FAD-dependent oxidoreductase [Solirubrobacterales bacterium]